MAAATVLQSNIPFLVQAIVCLVLVCHLYGTFKKHVFLSMPSSLVAIHYSEAGWQLVFKNRTQKVQLKKCAIYAQVVWLYFKAENGGGAQSYAYMLFSDEMAPSDFHALKVCARIYS